ncbi:hypothetical protein L6164_000528 [Bauhinia variegata]|uniref:Uncharacterized protein n=1 Tax=Bauhinia variegata TaxID=167791 RepID=A0ACB9Q9F9_BAUVA|nr:hypothetical protein L6164_000528 [Bauhinia variegata]
MAETKSSGKAKRWSLAGTTALVTGGTKGIGHAIAEELAEFGAAVHVCARNEEDVDRCLKEWQSKGFSVTGSVCDVSSHEQRKSLMETVSSIFQGKLNILVNNAGTNRVKKAEDYTAEDYTTIMGTNFESAYHLSQLAYPFLKESGCGNIVFISSVGGMKAFPLHSLYAATKGAMNQVTKNLAQEWAKDNIRVNTVAPGPVMTPLLESTVLNREDYGKEKVIQDLVNQTPLGRIGDPEDISALVAFLCFPVASFITGQVISADGGFVL